MVDLFAKWGVLSVFDLHSPHPSSPHRQVVGGQKVQNLYAWPQHRRCTFSSAPLKSWYPRPKPSGPSGKWVTGEN